MLRTVAHCAMVCTVPSSLGGQAAGGATRCACNALRTAAGFSSRPPHACPCAGYILGSATSTPSLPTFHAWRVPFHARVFLVRRGFAPPTRTLAHAQLARGRADSRARWLPNGAVGMTAGAANALQRLTVLLHTRTACWTTRDTGAASALCACIAYLPPMPYLGAGRVFSSAPTGASRRIRATLLPLPPHAPASFFILDTWLGAAPPTTRYCTAAPPTSTAAGANTFRLFLLFPLRVADTRAVLNAGRAGRWCWPSLPSSFLPV